jgi:hypothetical protein
MSSNKLKKLNQNFTIMGFALIVGVFLALIAAADAVVDADKRRADAGANQINSSTIEVDLEGEDLGGE